MSTLVLSLIDFPSLTLYFCMNGYTTPQKVQQRDAYRMCSNCNFNKYPLNTRVFRFQMNNQEVGYGLLLLGAVFLLEYLTDL